jgi:hypothetical protein
VECWKYGVGERRVVNGLLEVWSGGKKLSIWAEFCVWEHHWDQILKHLGGLLGQVQCTVVIEYQLSISVGSRKLA